MGKKCAALENVCTFSVAIMSVVFFFLSFVLIITGVVSLISTAGLQEVLSENLFYLIVIVGFVLFGHSILGLLTALYEIRIIEMTFSVVSLIMFIVCFTSGYALYTMEDSDDFASTLTITDDGHFASDEYETHVKCVYRAGCEGVEGTAWPGGVDYSTACPDYDDDKATYETACWISGCKTNCIKNYASNPDGTSTGFAEEYTNYIKSQYTQTGMTLLIVSGMMLLCTIGGIIDWCIFEQDDDSNGGGITGKVCDCCDTITSKCLCCGKMLAGLGNFLAKTSLRIGACSAKVLPFNLRTGLSTAAAISVVPLTGYILRDAPSFIVNVFPLVSLIMVSLLLGVTILRPNSDHSAANGKFGRNRLLFIHLLFSLSFGLGAVFMNDLRIDGFTDPWTLGFIFVALGGILSFTFAWKVIPGKEKDDDCCSKMLIALFSCLAKILCCCCKKNNDDN